jgi:hypothetical protein
MWFRLLRYRRKKGRGLSFPYIVGALREPIGASDSDEQRCFAEFEALVHSMAQLASANYTVDVRPCYNGGVAKPIVALDIRELYPEWGDSVDPPETSFQVAEDYLPLGTPSRDAAPHLWPHCKEQILSGNFSFDEKMGVYRPFDDEQRDDIIRALTHDDDDDTPIRS